MSRQLLVLDRVVWTRLLARARLALMIIAEALLVMRPTRILAMLAIVDNLLVIVPM